MNYDGAYPYLEGTDQLHDVPSYSRDLAERLELANPLNNYTWSTGANFPISAAYAPITSLARIDHNAIIPAGSPADTTELCLLTFTVQVDNKGSGADWVRVAPAVATGLSAYADPAPTSHTATHESIMVGVNPRAVTHSKTWVLNLAGMTSIRMHYMSSAIATLGYADLTLIPLRLVTP